MIAASRVLKKLSIASQTVAVARGTRARIHESSARRFGAVANSENTEAAAHESITTTASLARRSRR
ncbi:hypothetical protein [Microbacterium lacticum]